MPEGDMYFGAVDLQCEVNNTEHHTIEIDKDRLLVRRGQEFHLRVEFKQRAFLEGVDQLAMFLDTEPTPSEADGTRIQVLNSKLKWGKWTFRLQATSGYVHLAVQSPPSACTGHYHIYLILYPSGGESIQQITAGDFHLLFNPWCQDPSADIRRRNDPVYVSRIVTAMVNANDDKGVLLGRWDGNYADGIAPTRWTGSLPILRLWSSSGAEKVRYGQCWVFAAVACTVLRCLGIPSRCVTNYSSAHDTDGNLKVDQYYSSEDYSRIPSKRKDMVWNYHCWLEVWMTRPDLPPGYDGWQVLDPTPQERSDGIYCCGPCPVKAIKEGHVDVKYDAVFIFAEVNADVVYWLVNKDASKQELGVKQHQVGKQIITKSAYTDKREDLTHDYKYPEGSTKEREVYNKAGMKIRSADIREKDLKISIKYAQPIFGSDFDVHFSIVNHGFMDKEIHLTLSATTITYNGFILTEFSKRSITLTLKAATVQKEVLRLKYRDYGEHLSEHNLIRMTAMLILKGTSEVSLKECDIALNLPRLTVKVIGDPIVRRELTVQIKFANPLPITLTKGNFSVEGTGLTDLQEIKSPAAAIHPGQEVVVNVSFTPSKTGLRKLMVDFDSNRLHDVKGCASIIVRRA
ncbi:protein-glutamine gamma-glutamyltransferase 2 isoform X4 [Stegostoma tigrinum]|uniref:protein-glutamine gamma-glutamyltransferase 2 isoform X4 n=1 Tax=Stegostoma tigrinum TaxID=3053191 RepID=UPI00286FDED4|nr:protein-glutamine gamma-glutamyltransferase 2 isoform X4 [Stegostoma tigrinum]